MRRRITANAALPKFDDFTIPEQLAMIAGWSLAEGGKSDLRWWTWDAFLADYARVRDEVLAVCAGDTTLPFAERIRLDRLEAAR